MGRAAYLGFFDETGHSSEGEFVGLAGLVAPRRSWDAFEPTWTNILRAEWLPEFHARQFAHSTGPFASWKGDEPRRRALLGKLVDVIRAVKPTPVAAITDARAIRTMPEIIRSRIKDPYCHCFQTVARGAAICAMFEPGDVKVDIVLADMPERRGDAQKIWDLLPTAIDHGARLADLELSTPLKEPRLQAADLLAYEWNLEVERVSGRKKRSQRWAIRQLLDMAGSAHMMRYFGAAELKKIYGFGA
jgi:hypothetical protein